MIPLQRSKDLLTWQKASQLFIQPSAEDVVTASDVMSSAHDNLLRGNAYNQSIPHWYHHVRAALQAAAPALHPRVPWPFVHPLGGHFFAGRSGTMTPMMQTGAASQLLLACRLALGSSGELMARVCVTCSCTACAHRICVCLG